MSKISEVGMAQSQPGVELIQLRQDLEGWKVLERTAASRAAVFHASLREIAGALGVSGIADETLLRPAILEAIAKATASHEPDMAAEGGKNRFINGATAELTQMPTLGVSSGLESLLGKLVSTRYSHDGSEHSRGVVQAVCNAPQALAEEARAK